MFVALKKIQFFQLGSCLCLVKILPVNPAKTTKNGGVFIFVRCGVHGSLTLQECHKVCSACVHGHIENRGNRASQKQTPNTKHLQSWVSVLGWSRFDGYGGARLCRAWWVGWYVCEVEASVPNKQDWKCKGIKNSLKYHQFCRWVSLIWVVLKLFCDEQNADCSWFWLFGHWTNWYLSGRFEGWRLFFL